MTVQSTEERGVQIALLGGAGVVSSAALIQNVESLMGPVIFGTAAMLGFALGWCFSRHSKPYRPHALALIGAFATVIVGETEDEWRLIALIIFSLVAFMAAIGLGLMSGIKPDRTESFGSAQWADWDYLEGNYLLGGTGLLLGAASKPGKIERVHYESDRHLLTIAPTRSGKGVSAIIPNLLTYCGSALVIDPKGENALITSQARGAMGQDVFVVDPWGIASEASASQARFNPLDWLVRGDPDMTENAMLLADALVVPSQHGDRFWSEEAKALLQGLILYVATDEREQSARHLGRVRDLLLLDADEMEKLFERMADSPHHVVASTGARSLQKEDKLLANVVASAQAETHFLDSARIRDSLSSSNFKFEDLKAKAVTVYLVLPADRLNAFGRWLRLLIQQAITVNARNIAMKPDKPVLFLLDEMPSLGRLSMVEQASGLRAGFGMQLWGIVQDVSQLKRIYGDGWETFIGNSGVVQYFGSRDRMTAEYFSALCGVTTAPNRSLSIARGIGGNDRSTTESFSEMQRKLAFADELMRLPTDKQLVLIEYHRPIIATKIPWFEDHGLRPLGRNFHQAAKIAA